MSQEIHETLTEMENCFRLLLPDPFEFTVNDTTPEPHKEMTANEDSPAPALASQTAVTQSYVGFMDDEQPCCSKDILSASQSVRTEKNEDLADKQETPEQKELDEGTSSGVESGALALHDDDYETFVRNHGLISHKYTLDLEISTGTWNNFSQTAGNSLCLMCSVVVLVLL